MVRRSALNPLNHTSQGLSLVLLSCPLSVYYAVHVREVEAGVCGQDMAVQSGPWVPTARFPRHPITAVHTIVHDRSPLWSVDGGWVAVHVGGRGSSKRAAMVDWDIKPQRSGEKAGVDGVRSVFCTGQCVFGGTPAEECPRARGLALSLRGASGGDVGGPPGINGCDGEDT